MPLTKDLDRSQSATEISLTSTRHRWKQYFGSSDAVSEICSVLETIIEENPAAVAALNWSVPGKAAQTVIRNRISEFPFIVRERYGFNPGLWVDALLDLSKALQKCRSQERDAKVPSSGDHHSATGVAMNASPEHPFQPPKEMRAVHSISIHNIDVRIHNRVDPKACGEVTVLDFIPMEKWEDLGEMLEVSLLDFEKWGKYLKEQCGFDPQKHLIHPIRANVTTGHPPVPIHSVQ